MTVKNGYESDTINMGRRIYQKVLIPLENGPADTSIIQHIQELSPLLSGKIVLVHVSDGWVARNYDRLYLQPSEEMATDLAYLETQAALLNSQGFDVEYVLGKGDPATEIAAIADEEQVDLIAMATHGHRLFGDIIYGSTADKLRHRTTVPILMIRG